MKFEIQYPDMSVDVRAVQFLVSLVMNYQNYAQC